MQQIFLDLGISQEKENIETVLKELSCTCHKCRLSILHPNNRGLIWRGNPSAKVAVVGEAPGNKETEMGLPLVGVSGQEWERWARHIGLDTKNNCLLTNTVQCMPPRTKTDEKGKSQQRPPEADEIVACFGDRCYRLLKAMPNLECVITLGWIAARALLGGEPGIKTHEGQWFSTSLLPGVAVFCLVHPSYILRDPTPEKNGRLEECLKNFKREYLETKKVIPLARGVTHA